ncbi:MAG: 30S ribosomal protein S21 [Patescibacteria group bacterium]|nr:30S ribosomal protein S21 [Patescibacteria group bacterium]MDE2144611.1 30S ribosomal protein S21 [Patescibacteria group bacterium]
MPAIIVRRKEGEQASSLVYRFTKKVKQSGVLLEAKRRRFSERQPNRAKRRLSAIHRSRRSEETGRARPFGK